MPAPAASSIPTSVTDPVNAKVLAISEDRIQGFRRDPLHAIAEQAETALPVVVERLAAMLEAGTIRRVRQTLLATSLAPGALVAWNVPPKNLQDAFNFMFKEDPFSGHVVLRTTDKETPGSAFKLWTTVKVPKPYSLAKHCAYLAEQTGATCFQLLPAKKLFALGVGHVRRKDLTPGDRTDEPGRVLDTTVVDLNDRQWRVLMALKREFTPEELLTTQADPDQPVSLWAGRAEEAGESLDDFCEQAEQLQNLGVIGRFSTFLEHVKRHKDGQRVTKYNALFHWKVPPGMELDAGKEVGRHHCMTHAYWRQGGPAFSDVNIMGVSHGTEKDKVLAHKAAIDQHLEEAGIPVQYTNVFWGGQSEIKPSEVSPIAYKAWCNERGIDPDEMKG